MWRILLLVLTAVPACSRPQSRVASQDSVARWSADSAFALVQSRGHQAMGVDQYTSTHRFESLPDGGRITLERNGTDPAGTAQIRSHMQAIALAFKHGDFALPGFVHDREVPGTAVMMERRSQISYRTDTLPHGAELLIHSADTTAINAIHEFLAFQRQDHRVAGGGAH